MSFAPIFAGFGSGGAGAGGLELTHLYIGSDDTGRSGQTNIAWDSEVQDDGGWHSTVTNTDRITPGAGDYDVWLKCKIVATGSTNWALLTVNVYNSSDVLQREYRTNGSDSADSDLAYYNAFLPKVPVSADDYIVITTNVAGVNHSIIASDTDTRQTEVKISTSVFS